MQRDPATVLDLLRAARFIIEFKGDNDEQSFRSDYKTQAAILHELLIMGEAVKRLSPAFRAVHAEAPWSKVAGMRDILIHQYDDVDLHIIWESVCVDVPALIAALEPFEPTGDGVNS